MINLQQLQSEQKGMKSKKVWFLPVHLTFFILSECEGKDLKSDQGLSLNDPETRTR